MEQTGGSPKGKSQYCTVDAPVLTDSTTVLNFVSKYVTKLWAGQPDYGFQPRYIFFSLPLFSDQFLEPKEPSMQLV
jgi:hypothetical protein